MAAARPLRVGVLALQGAVSEHMRALSACGAEAVDVRSERELADLQGLVIPGGESTTVGLLLHKQGWLEPLRQRVQGGLPTWGTCMGLILLAARVTDGVPGQPTLGCMDVTVRRNAFGRQVDSCVTELQLAGDALPFPGVFIRAPEVVAVGHGVDVLARRGERIVAVRDRHLLGTSFHPELTGDTRLHQLFLRMVGEAS